MYFILAIIILSLLASGLVIQSIPKLASLFIAAGIYGKDLCKRKQTEKIPEAQGLVCGTIFLIVMFLFLGIRFGSHFMQRQNFPHLLFSQFLTALLSICCMLLLGFADDVLNLKWRYKLILPTLASIPLLMVYYINEGSTTVIIPKPLRDWLGLALDIGPLYFVFMSLLAVFCTNAINIYAGVNGLECGQTLVIAASVAAFNMMELQGFQGDAHLFSLCFMLPFAGTCIGVYHFNRYPAQVFVGDTFTYFAGMSFAVVGIVGHFSKTMLLFFMPQVINFIYSTPQLFKLLPCPRHRLPRYNPEKDLLEFSEVTLMRNNLKFPLLPLLHLLHRLKLVHLREEHHSQSTSTETKDSSFYLNNLTLINLVLLWFGPMNEAVLTRRLLFIQLLFSGFAFFIRYPLANFFYD